MKRIIALLLVLVMALGLAACGAPAAEEKPADVAMQYIKADEAKELLEDDSYVFFDIRKAADSSANSIPGALAYDMDAAKEGDAEAGKATMTEATKGLDKKIILVCYSGKRYAQAATNALSAIGYDMTKVFTLEGGFTNWSEVYPELTTAGAPAATEAAAVVEAVDQRRVYVTPEWLNSAMKGEQAGYENVVVAECAYGAVEGIDSYNNGHIDGAIYVDICEVEDATGDEIGAYNLLPAADVEKYLLSHGITKDTKVVLYGGDVSGVGRVAYAYLWAGVEDVKILNGGLAAWTAAGFEANDKEVHLGTAADNFGTAVPANPQFWVSVEDARNRVETDANFKLVSIRSEVEFLGETSGYGYMDKAGEPRGAVWGKGPQTASDVADFTNEDGTIKELAELKEIWADCDFTLDNHLSFYCGTGWRATVPFLVMYQEGYNDISVYDGGWYQWLMHDDYPVQVGDPASDNCQYMTVGELPTGMATQD